MIAPLDREHIDIILKTQYVGRLGCSENDQAYVVPVTYVYENGFVYGHTNDGKKVRVMRKNPKVCFEVDEIRDPGNWQSVIVIGTFEELHNEEAAKALDLIFSRLAPFAVSETLGETTTSTDSISHDIRLKSTKGVTYRIRVSDLSGRYERH